jgi:hypothetical protein
MMMMILWIWCPTIGSIKDEISAWKLTEDTAPVRSCMPKAQILGATSDLDHCGKLPPKKNRWNVAGEKSVFWRKVTTNAWKKTGSTTQAVWSRNGGLNPLKQRQGWTALKMVI